VKGTTCAPLRAMVLAGLAAEGNQSCRAKAFAHHRSGYSDLEGKLKSVVGAREFRSS